MFSALLAATFLSAAAVCGLTIAIFIRPISWILKKRLSPEATALWTRTLLFTMSVAGISVGARLWDLQRYMNPAPISGNQLALEVYKSALATAEANAAVILLACLGLGVVAFMTRREPAEGAQPKAPL